MNKFNVKYCRKNQIMGTQSFPVFAASTTSEEVLFEFVLSDLCESNYHTHYWWQMLNEHIFVKRIKAAGPLCEYQVLLFDIQERSKLVVEYEVEIDCIINDGTVDIFHQEEDLQTPTTKKPKKEKLPTEWFLKESSAIKGFLILLNHYGNLKELKMNTNKATYYRNLKICLDKGYVKNGKLVKRLFVSKMDK